MARRDTEPSAWTPNQIVAYRVAKARLLRGWTQDQAARELEPYLGHRLSSASFSAIERSFVGGRVREFDADEIVALARGFRLPIGWFFTPPPRFEGVALRTPDAGRDGLDPILLIDLILSDPDALAVWNDELAIWPGLTRRGRIGPDGKIEDLGPTHPPVHDRLADLVRARARVRTSEVFGDTDQAKDVLARLLALLDDLTDPQPPDQPTGAEAPRSSTGKRRPPR